MMGSSIAARVSSANASPTLTQGSTSPVEDLISQCPSSSEVASFNADLAISFEGDPTAGTLVCHATDGSADLTRFQERTYQALRVMKALRFSRSLPWTSLNLYDWFAASVRGIRFRSDITFSFCCDPVNVINILASSNSAALFTNRWIDPTAPIGLHDLVALLVHEARHNNGKPHTCGADDQTVSELGAWGTEYYLELWESLYAGSFLTSPDVYPSYYRDQHLLSSEFYLPRICTLPNADLSLAINSPNVAVRGTTVTYTFTAANTGPDTASDVFVYSPVPSGTTFVGATTSQGSCNAAATEPIACSFGSIASGSTARAEVSLLVDASSALTQITNKEAPAALGARVTAPVRDSNSANNAASFSTPVMQPSANDLLNDLMSKVRSFNLSRGIENSLLTKLRGARQKTASGRTNPACGQLRAFTNEVGDLRASGLLTSTQAALLLDEARLVQSVIPCF